MSTRVPERPAARALRIRAMRAGDLSEVLDIEAASFSVPWSERTFRGLLGRPNAALLVAEEEGAGGPRHASRLLGYAVVWMAGREAELGDLAVRVEARRRGVGSALLTAGLEAAARAGAARIFLEVREGNLAARRLYERAGFEVVGIRPGYYARPVEDALVMRRALPAWRRERADDPAR